MNPDDVMNFVTTAKENYQIVKFSLELESKYTYYAVFSNGYWRFRDANGQYVLLTDEEFCYTLNYQSEGQFELMNVPKA